jgi:SAM-dependent methyltransferase
VSGFASDWLALREPADRRARNADLAARLRDAFAGRAAVRVVDLGCGTGANLRATAPLLPPRQHWTLVDHDPALLAAARTTLSHGEGAPATVPLPVATTFVDADLTKDLEEIIPTGTDLVTTAALLDLVSPPWLERLAALLATRVAPLYAVLTVDGTFAWDPPHPSDAAVTAAFNAHLGRDKGFGPAAGAAATAVLADALRRRGYVVATAPSRWRLGRGDAALTAAVARAVAHAATESGVDTSAWLDFRLAGGGCVVGHRDLLALPAATARIGA